MYIRIAFSIELPLRVSRSLRSLANQSSVTGIALVPAALGLIGEDRSERDTLSRSSMKNAIRIYTYIYRYVRHTLVARSWGDVMWEELSVSHF